MTRRLHFCSYPVLCCLLTICSGYLAVCPSSVAGVKVLETVTSEQAQEHIGEINTVCGLVATTRYLDSEPAQPTFLNFDRPYPRVSCSRHIECRQYRPPERRPSLPAVQSSTELGFASGPYALFRRDRSQAPTCSRTQPRCLPACTTL